MVITLPEATLERIKKIDWFAHCGEELTLPLTMDFVQIYSWERAQGCWSDPDWINAGILASNEITAWLSTHHRKEYSQWNTVVGSARAWMDAELQPFWENVCKEHGLNEKKFIRDMRWTFIHLVMEDAYGFLGHPSHFFAELLTIFEAGHYPCGWDGGEWPSGHLIIY